MLVYTSNLSFFFLHSILISCLHVLVEYVETCLALERRELFGIKCNNDAYCQSVSDCDIHKGEQSHCIDGKCWCFLPPSSANKHT